MKENKELVFNVGTPSILLILLVFVLSTFAILSIQASDSEWKLAEKTGESVKTYYAADEKAEYVLCYVDAILQNTDAEYLEDGLVGMEGNAAKDIEGLENLKVNIKDRVVFEEKKKNEIAEVAYDIVVKEGTKLQVELQLFSDRSYDITSWKIKQEELGVYDLEDNIELLDGNVTE